MSSVLEIERAILALSPSEKNELYAWMDENCPIEAQIKADLDAGRIDGHISRALADHRAADTQAL